MIPQVALFCFSGPFASGTKQRPVGRCFCVSWRRSRQKKKGANIMLQPFYDSYSVQFHSFTDMMTHHARQTRESRWVCTEVSNLHVEPLDHGSPLYGDPSGFASDVSERAIQDTARNLGLALQVHGMYYPLRGTAYGGLTGRARIGGTALPKLKRRDLADVLNACLELHRDFALLLIREEKVSAVHSGDQKDYAVLPVDQLLESIRIKLDERFPGSEFNGGYSDHSLTSAAWSLPGQKEDLLGAYQKTLIAQGKIALADKLLPGIRFSTSDTGDASAKIAALLLGLQHPIHIGGMVSVKHRGEAKIEDFQGSLDMLFAQFNDSIKQLEHLMNVYLDYPVNAMVSVCKKLSMPKKAALEAVGMFEASYGGGPATAHDVFMAMQEIMFILKTSGMSEGKMLVVEENMARALTLKWSDHDFAKAVNW
jgi:hypothetical protein